MPVLLLKDVETALNVAAAAHTEDGMSTKINRIIGTARRIAVFTER